MTNQRPGGKAAGVHFVATLNGHSAPITSLIFSASGALFASGCQAGSVRVWDMMVGLCLRVCMRVVCVLCVCYMCVYLRVYSVHCMCVSVVFTRDHVCTCMCESVLCGRRCALQC